MIANVLWFAEFALEALGAYFLFRRKFVPLWVWLIFAAVADFVAFLVLQFGSYNSYNFADYYSRMIQYVLIAASSVYVAAMLLKESPKTRKAYMVALCATALYAIVAFHSALHSVAQILSFEVWMELVLAAFMALAMAMANGKAPKPWGLIACALIIRAAGDLLVTVGRLQGWRIEEFYPVGEIVTLMVLVVVGYRDYTLEEFRQPIPKKFEPTSVWASRIHKGVM